MAHDCSLADGHHSTGQLAAAADIARIANATRTGFRLVAHHPVRVEQMATTEQGFPPLETRITFWSGNESEHRYRVFKPASQVSLADLPPWWMKDALILDPFPFCDCCG